MKRSVGIYGLTGCGGDQLTILNCEEKLVDMFELADIRSFVMAKSDNVEEEIDIALVEGSVSTEEQREHLLEIRENAGTVIAIGNCSCYGGPQAMEIGRDVWEDNLKKVYGDIEMEHTIPLESKPIGAYVDVDMCIPGCPIDKYEIMDAFAHLIKDMPLSGYTLPVCAECKFRQNRCLLNEGRMCLGPVTKAGCNAVCPSLDIVCVGCQGPVDGSNVASELSLLQEKGFTKEDIIDRMRMYGGSEAVEKLKEVLEGGEPDE